jgi:non-specific serine/threonine protein kinase
VVVGVDTGGPAFGTILRRLRLEAGLSQEALAERARMSVDAISALERGTRRSPQRATLALLVEGLQLDAATRVQFEAAAARPGSVRREATDNAATATATPVKRNHNLPFALTSFVGREAERAALGERLTTDRLLTIVGTGGVGKTRLALEVAHAVLDRFADGVWLVELAGIRDAALVVPAICAALGIREEPGSPLIETLLGALKPSEHLIVIDNCEHLIATVAPLVSTLLASSARLRVVCTSREPLRVIGERLHRVAPLPVEPSGGEEGAAVRLFVDRARAVDGDFVADDASLEAVRTIARRLDGLPLAIELAAARVGVFSVGSIVKRLETRLGALASAPHAAIPHQITIRALIDWSYDQLEPLEQVLFRRLAVFSGGWTLEAAETIVADEGLDRIDVFESLSLLADKSLIVAEPGHERFRLLETMREYGLEKLDAAGERARYVAQHAAYYLDFAARSARTLRGPLQPQTYAALTADVGNVRAALDASVDAFEHDERPLRALAAMMEYWHHAGSYAEGRARVAAIERLALPPSKSLAAVYLYATEIAISESLFADARRFVGRAANAATETRDPLLVLHIEAVTLLADVLDGEPVAGERVATLRERAEALGERDVLQTVTTAQGFLAAACGDMDAAQIHFEEAVGYSREMGDPMTTAASSLVLARLALLRTDPIRAAIMLADAVPFLAAREHLAALASALDGLVVVASIVGEHIAGARFYGTSRRMHRISGNSAIAMKAPPIPEETLREMRDALGDARFDELAAEGERAFASDIVEAVRVFSLAVR